MKWPKEAEIIKLLKTGEWRAGFHVVPLQRRKSYWIQSENQYKSIHRATFLSMKRRGLLIYISGGSFGRQEFKLNEKAQKD